MQNTVRFHLAKLVEQAVEGREEAFAELYGETIDAVYKTIYFLAGSGEEVDDIVQDVYVELYRNLSKFDPSRSLHAWLYGIAFRQHLAYRRKRWRQFRIAEAGRIAMSADEGVVPDFSSSLVDYVSREPLFRHLDGLTYKHKQVIVLRFVNEFSQEQIADLLNIPVGTVKSRLHAAIQKLRSTIGRERDV